MTESLSSSRPWPVRRLEPLSVEAGLCAWRASMLGNPPYASYVKAHPSLLVIEPEDDDAVLARVAEHAPHMPVAIRMNEPAFVRRFEAQVRERIEKLGRSKAEMVIVNVEDTSDLKSGGLIQVLFSLREHRIVEHVGLAALDVLAAEWIAHHTAARVLMFPFGIDDQQARYRLLPLVKELGQVCLASQVTPADEASLSFALGAGSLVLPVCDQPLPAGIEPVTDAQVESSWQTYQASHKAPPPLPRSRPPE